MVLLTVSIAIIFIFLLYRYSGWGFSYILARFFGCNFVRFGKFGFLYLSNVKLCLHNDFVIEVDDLKLSTALFASSFTRPFLLSAGDIRVEGTIPVEKSSASKKQIEFKLSPGFERCIHWLQYISVVIRTARIAFLDVVPGCLLHSTFETLHMDIFRNREGYAFELKFFKRIQLELMCRLAQAKLFERSSFHASALFEVSLGGTVSLDFSVTDKTLKRIGISVGNPEVNVCDGLFKHFGNTASKQKQRNSSGDDGSLGGTSSRLALTQVLPDVKLDITSFTFNFMANLGDSRNKEHTLSTTMSSITASVDESSRFSVALANLNVVGFSPRSNFKCMDFVINFNKSFSDIVTVVMSFDVRVFNPRCTVCLNDLAFWVSYEKEIQKLIYGCSSETESSLDLIEHAAQETERSVNLKDATHYLVSMSAEINGLHCCLIPVDGRDIDIGIDIITFASVNNFSNAELGVEFLRVHYGCVNEDAGCFSFGRHNWGTPIALCAGLAQYTTNSERHHLVVELDEGHIEYADDFAQQVAQFVSILFSSDNVDNNEKFSQMDSRNNLKTEFIIQLSAQKLIVFLVAQQASFVFISMEHVLLNSTSDPLSTSVSIGELYLGQHQVTNAEFSLLDVKAEEEFGKCDSLIICSSSTPLCCDFMIRGEAPVLLIWDPLIHIILLETYWSFKKARALCLRKQLFEKSSFKTYRLRIESQNPVTFKFRLPRNHIMQWEVVSLLFQRNDQISFIFPHFIVRMDDNPIVTLEEFKVYRHPVDAKMDLGRAEFQNLIDRTNKAWIWTAESVLFIFPYGYDFAACFDEVINSWKWIKLVHGIKPKPFTVNSPLPSDLSFSIKKALFQINDDPFEVQLHSNYELMADEVYECERRRQMLDQRLETRKQWPLLPGTATDEIRRSLLEKNAEIYIERSKKSPPLRNHLLQWTMCNLEIRAYADRSVHGKDNCVRLMESFNPEAAFPPEGMEFSTLWARAIELDFDEFKVQFRDYPFPYMFMQDGHFWGRLFFIALGLFLGSRSIRNCSVMLPAPWNEYIINRNMCPLKFYYDLECEVEKIWGTYGPCWEPCLSMISLCWNCISAPSRDPSVPLPIWDKIRLLFHGRLSMLCKQFDTFLLASTDPYNSTERLEISWKNFEFDWTSGQFLVQTDVSAVARTASKYDECRVLYLPGFKFSVVLKWKCNGNEHDHHSAFPYAPDKLPEYSSTNHEHDSYHNFRSLCLDVSINCEVKMPSDLKSYNEFPHVLLYANTFRWLDFLKNTMTTVNRPIKRGPLFGSHSFGKLQLSRHFRHIRIDLTLPKFLFCYRMSFSSTRGFRLIGENLHLLSSLELQFVENESLSQVVFLELHHIKQIFFHLLLFKAVFTLKDGVRRRRLAKWSISYVSADLSNVQIVLFGDNPEIENGVSNTMDDTHSFFLGLNRLTYTREPTKEQRTRFSQTDSETNVGTSAVHRLAIHDLRASWTPENRDTCLAIADGIQRAHMLRKILSTNALKAFSVEDVLVLFFYIYLYGIELRSRFGSDGRIIEENDLLQKLIDEAGTKLMAYSEELAMKPCTAKEVPSNMLHGIALCSADDVFLTNWQIDLINSQVVLCGEESNGFILLTATRASVTQRIHLPVWKKSQLLAKRSWCAVLSGMQYFAPLILNNHSTCSSPAMQNKENNFRWLPKEVIEEKACSDPNISDRLDNFINTGEAVGGVVADKAGNLHSETKSQLQRVVSRCSCQIYFCYFSDTFDLDMENMPIPIDDFYEADKAWRLQEPVDCFTLKHNMLEVSTNSAQYEMAMNIINRLVLFVDPRKQELEGRRQHLRFENQLKSVEEVSQSIASMQAELRDIIANIRMYERQSYFLNQQFVDNPCDLIASETSQYFTDEINRLKREQLTLTDELAMTISYFKEKQVERMRQLVDSEQNPVELVSRRFEVCFEDCIWRLTESDGQIGLAKMQIRNFLYTRIARIDNSGEHLLEIGTVKVTNLLPDSVYKHVLQLQSTSKNKKDREDEEDSQSIELRPSIRLLCRDSPPGCCFSVGGICVKEHFEVNVSPMVAQITYRFFMKIMVFFFPGRNIVKADQQILDSDDQQMTPVSFHIKFSRNSNASLSVRQLIRDAMNGSFRKVTETSRSRDDIDRMKERAQQNNLFCYIKIPPVSFLVSYKGNKDKNLGDVDRFQFSFPLCEFHEKNWTWLDLALAVKQRCKKALIQQYMKQKLLRNRRNGAEGETTEIDEEEKKRVVLGLVMFPDKEKKNV
uniref:Fmp27_GFWDK domain-containing protein n=1 Tax=Syphacia muris TaxID=451379 RepID=A0A0N5AL93_9BILA